MSSLPTTPSFMSLDQMHFLATGEHLSPRKGDYCPHPAEWYIRRTQARQQRQRAYDILLQVARNSAEPGEITPVKPGEVNGVRYNGIRMTTGSEAIELFQGLAHMMSLWPDGHEQLEPSPAPSGTATPAQPFRLAAAPSGRTDCQSPLMLERRDVAAAAATGIVEIPAPTSRLRYNFRKFLSELSVEALRVELAEWNEEMERALEHMEAVEAELVRREE